MIHENIRKTTSVHPAGETFSDIHARLLEQKSALEQHFGETLTIASARSFCAMRRAISLFVTRTATRGSSTSITCASDGSRSLCF